MPTFHLEYKSTVAERYSSLMNEQVEKVLSSLAPEGHSYAAEGFGGSDGMSADNGFTIEAGNSEVAIEAAEQVADEIKKVVTVTTEDHVQIHQTKARFAEDDVAGMLTWATGVVEKQGGRLAVASDPPTAQDQTGARWLVGLEFGEETPGSMMYGGAAYGEGATLAEALTNLVRDAGV